MIPKDKYKFDLGIGDYVTFAQVKEHHTEWEYLKFLEWMNGQTMGMAKDGTGVIYCCDYDRWVREGMKTEQGANWD